MKHYLFSFIFLTISMVAVNLVHSSHGKNNSESFWQSSHFIWNFSIISECTKNLPLDPKKYFEENYEFDPKYYQNIKSGDIVWIRCKCLSRFCKDILPTIKNQIILLIADGDESFPSDCGEDFDIEKLLNHPSIIHIFAQNNDYKGDSKKISHFPIGMDYHTIAYKGNNGGWGEKGSPCDQEAHLHAILATLKPTALRKKRAFVDFQLSDTMHGEYRRYLQFGEDRQSIFNQLVSTGLLDYASWMKRSELWRTKGEYAFSISPHGNGLDCHRTWEDLILGCIVIVKTSPLDPLYEGLPVVIIKDWSEVTLKNLDTWLNQYGDAFSKTIFRARAIHSGRKKSPFSSRFIIVFSNSSFATRSEIA